MCISQFQFTETVTTDGGCVGQFVRGPQVDVGMYCGVRCCGVHMKQMLNKSKEVAGYCREERDAAKLEAGTFISSMYTRSTGSLEIFLIT